jgi:hypothetical protein
MSFAIDSTRLIHDDISNCKFTSAIIISQWIIIRPLFLVLILAFRFIYPLQASIGFSNNYPDIAKKCGKSTVQADKSTTESEKNNQKTKLLYLHLTILLKICPA